MTVINIDKNNIVRKRLNTRVRNVCSVKTLKKRLPITEWLPQYTWTKLLQDIIAGITVGLTAIPQGIAYAVVAGLSPEYGLYAGLVGGFIYLFFGSSKDITVGPTAVLSTMIGKYIAGYNADFAVLAAFLSGVIELVLGILHMGFVVEFISMSVITGFTTAAAFQIAASQLKGLLGLQGSSGSYFAESMMNFFKNVTTIQTWDSILGVATVVILVLLKRLGEGCNRTDSLIKSMKWFISLARNAFVVVIGMIIAYIIYVTTGSEPITLIGEIGNGLPSFKIPPFQTVLGNETLKFTDMLQVLGPESIVLPLVAILESVAIAKAFSAGIPVDATQEMMAVGLCNILGSFFSSMPITGSFTRTALNNASGVQTPAGGIFTGMLIILALSLMTSTFYFIPKPTLAGLIITAMYYMVDFSIFPRLWNNNKMEFIVLVTTLGVCLGGGLEFGIICGIITDACFLMYSVARPKMEINMIKNDNEEMIVIPLTNKIAYCAAEHIRRGILEASFNLSPGNTLVVIDGANLKHIDSTVASNLLSLVKDLEKNSRQIVYWNFNGALQKLCLDINPKLKKRFIHTSSEDDIISVFKHQGF